MEPAVNWRTVSGNRRLENVRKMGGKTRLKTFGAQTSKKSTNPEQTFNFDGTFPSKNRRTNWQGHPMVCIGLCFDDSLTRWAMWLVCQTQSFLCPDWKVGVDVNHSWCFIIQQTSRVSQLTNWWSFWLIPESTNRNSQRYLPENHWDGSVISLKWKSSFLVYLFQEIWKIFSRPPEAK